MKIRGAARPRAGCPRTGAERLLLIAWLGLMCTVLFEVYTAGQRRGCAAGNSTNRHAAALTSSPTRNSETLAEPRSVDGGAHDTGAMSWQQVDELMQQSSAVHGRQRKGGMPANWPALLAHMTNKNAQLHGVPEFMSEAVFKWFAAAHT